MRSLRSQSMLVLALALLLGCSEAPPAKDAATIAPAAADDAAVLAKLAAADKLDGKEDKIVTNCYLCGLGMDGSAEFAAEYEGYTVHLCSDHCRESFEKDPVAVIAQTDVPEAP